MVHIVLTGIVRNESRIIRRMLDSARGIIDAVAITDTGSTDDTVAIIQSWGHDAGLPTKVFSDTWRDFGSNRTQSFANARAYATELFESPDNVYALLLDADHRLDVKVQQPRDLTKDWSADAYMLLQVHGTCLQYYNVRFIRMKRAVECVGVTHEYWAVDNPPRLDWVQIRDEGDGGCKDDKFERDLLLLTKGLQSEPTNHRYMFYIGETLRNLGKYAESRIWYDRRALEFHSFEEERWYAMYMSATCAENLKDPIALDLYLRAFDARPHRNEPLVAAIDVCLNQRRHHLAWILIQRAVANPIPHGDVLFVDIPAHTHRPLFQQSICGYYVGKLARKDSQLASQTLLSLIHGGGDFLESVQLNLQFYVDPLPGSHQTSLVEPQSSAVYVPCNPSIVCTKDGYMVFLRTVNYRMDSKGMYFTHDFGAPVRFVHTETWLQFRDVDMKLQRSWKLPFPELQESDDAPHIQGVEDVRAAARPDGTLSLSGTLWNPEHQRLVIGQTTLHVNDSPDKTPSLKPTSMVFEWCGGCEKNWLPFYTATNNLHFLYKINEDGYTILTDEYGTRTRRPVQLPNPKAFQHLRGSAGPIEWDEGYLVLSHELCRGSLPRIYLHRFVVFDRSFQLLQVSYPFYFQHIGVEFACGMSRACDQSENVIITYGVHDKEAFSVCVSKDSIAALLRDP